MAVYKPRRKGEASKFFVCEFMHGRRIQESTGSTSRTVAKAYEKRRRVELERAAAGLPTEEKQARLRSVTEVAGIYLEGYKLNHRSKSIVFAKGCLAHVTALLGAALSDLTEEPIRGYIRQRQQEGACGRTINMELGELSRAIGASVVNPLAESAKKNARTWVWRCRLKSNGACWIRWRDRRRRTCPR
jgi:hypothetical protein